MTSGRTDKEIVADLEAYYNQLCLNCDQEIIRLREQLEIAEAQERSEMADDLVLPMNELDELSNFFLDCIHAQRKSLRHKLVRIQNTGGDDPRQRKVLDTFMQMMKTGQPEGYEMFSKIEREKLVELLCMN
mmetsp:Transcript_13890/g.21654  ORF Transcript_13890/g.21654 Transcript_13890/m.21654 type:complete len:131 (-) Transcript_13890:282-674(-)